MLAVIWVVVSRTLLIVHPNELPLCCIRKSLVIAHRVATDHYFLLVLNVCSLVKLVANCKGYSVGLYDNVINEQRVCHSYEKWTFKELVRRDLPSENALR
jgi:hypothetical protein